MCGPKKKLTDPSKFANPRRLSTGEFHPQVYTDSEIIVGDNWSKKDPPQSGSKRIKKRLYFDTVVAGVARCTCNPLSGLDCMKSSTDMIIRQPN